MENFRIPGEFEKQESVLTVWPVDEWSTKDLEIDAVSVEMVGYLVNYVKVIVVCFNEDVRERAICKLTGAGINISGIEFHVHEIDNQYPRDFGAEVLIKADGKRVLADFRFVEYAFIPGNLDFSFGKGMRDFNRYHARLSGITQTISSWIASEGGDREFNGKGVMISIEDTEVNKRNPGKTRNEIEEEYKRILNLNRIIWIPMATYDDENVLDGPIPGPDGSIAYRAATANGHIDEMCRFVSHDTIVIAHISDDEADRDELAALNKQRLDMAYDVVSKSTDQNGKPFRIVRMPVPDPIYVKTSPGEFVWEGLRFFVDANGGKFFDGTSLPEQEINVLPALSYCNFLITNGLVIAQKYWTEGMPESIRIKDEQAMEILTNLFPDRKVVAINTLALNITGGGIHCHTRNIPR